MSDMITMDDLTEENMAKLAAMVGQTETRSNVQQGLPRLAIEQQADNDDGEPLPKGSFRIRLDNNTVYAKEITVRMFVRYYSYDLWNQQSPEDSIRTVLAPSLSDDFPDTSGGMKCGKLNKQEFEALSTNSLEHAKQKSIKCTQVVYGVITGAKDATDSTGETIDLKGTPFIWSARGSAFMPVANYIREVPSNKIIFGQKVNIATKRHKNGGITYYTPVFDKPQPVKIVDEDVETLNTFMKDIERWNERVLKQYNERKENVLAMDDLDVAKALENAEAI
jgi:hypothetical protein